MAIEWVARYWMKLPDEADAVRGRRVYQPFKDFDYRRDEALMAQNAKWDNIAQVYAQADRQADLQAMGLAAYMQQDFNKVDLQYQQGRKHGKGGASREQSETSFGSAEAQPALDVVKKDDDEDGGGDVTPVVPEVSE